MSQALIVTRKELKYQLNYVQRARLTEALMRVLDGDPFNRDQSYLVRSVYFDNFANTDYYDKINGQEKRKKIRLRIYSPNDQRAKLEIKRKYNNEQIKQSVWIAKEDAEKLLAGDYDCLEKYQEPTVVMIYSLMKINHLRPVVMVEYMRRTFTHSLNKIRIALDSEIRASETDFELFKAESILRPVDPGQMTLLEVKYNGYLPQWINDVLSKYQVDVVSFSKYTISRRIFEEFIA